MYILHFTFISILRGFKVEDGGQARLWFNIAILSTTSYVSGVYQCIPVFDGVLMSTKRQYAKLVEDRFEDLMIGRRHRRSLFSAQIC